MRLMIVDDSPLMRTFIQNTLEGELTIVGQAENGRAAVELFEGEKPELVTMDITMPEMDGLECIEALMKIDTNVKIVVVSAMSAKTTALKALQLGAKRFLAKPFTEEQLVEALRKAML